MIMSLLHTNRPIVLMSLDGLARLWLADVDPGENGNFNFTQVTGRVDVWRVAVREDNVISVPRNDWSELNTSKPFFGAVGKTGRLLPKHLLSRELPQDPSAVCLWSSFCSDGMYSHNTQQREQNNQLFAFTFLRLFLLQSFLRLQDLLTIY